MHENARIRLSTGVTRAYYRVVTFCDRIGRILGSLRAAEIKSR